MVMKTMMMANSEKATPLPALMRQMYADQGMGGFYRGTTANVARAGVRKGPKMAC